MKKIKLFEAFVNEGKEEAEAKAILQDLMDEFDPWELVDMLPQDAEDTVAAYGHKGAKAKKIADYLLSMAQNGEFESKVNEAMSFQDLVNKYKDNPYGIGANSIEYVESENWGNQLILRFEDNYSRKETEAELKKMGIKAKKISKSTADKAFKYRYELTVFESKVNEAKSLDRDTMIEWLEKYMKFVRTTEEFDGSTGGIWVSGENMDVFKGKRIYDYYNDSKAYELGVLAAWEKELDKRGWYSEWYDAGTVMIWPS